MLWGNIDHATGNLKPLFANTSNVTSNSTINGSIANTDAAYGMVMGVSVNEVANSVSKVQHPTHAGWVSIKLGTGPVASVNVSNVGLGINSAGYFIITDNSLRRGGTGANVSYAIANLQNTMQAYSSNAQLNVINSISVISGGSGYTNASAITIVTNGTAIANANLAVVLGGRAGRMTTETLIAMGSITDDDAKDNVYFTNV